jgi:trk system potassium uptake protein TrkH
MFSSVWDTLRHSFFQVASIISTSGFATCDFDQWPTFSKAILFCLMMLGASAGSTGGGLKCARLLILLKAIRRNIKQVVHPKTVRVVRVNGQAMDERIISNTTAYFAVYILIMVISLVIVSLNGFAFGDSVSAVVSCFNNIGPGFGAFGATMNYGGASVLSKITLIFDMLLGRLEIFPILILFSANTWKKY